MVQDIALFFFHSLETFLYSYNNILKCYVKDLNKINGE